MQPKFSGEHSTKATKAEHIGVGPQGLMLPVFQYLHAKNTLTRVLEPKNVRAIAKLHASLLAEFGQCLSELAGIAGFIFRGVGCACYLVLDRFEARLNLYSFVCIDDLTVAPEITHDAGGLKRCVKLVGVGIKVQNTLGNLIVLKPGFLTQIL